VTLQQNIRAKRTEFMWFRVGNMVYDHDVLIFGTRYGGTYEGGAWIAWVGDPEWLDDYQSGDNACQDFWQDYKFAPIGRGDSPEEALEDLRLVAALGPEKWREEVEGTLKTWATGLPDGEAP
jgi:hypothetical protein